MSAAGRGDRAPCRRARHPGRGDADLCVNLSQSGRPGEALATLDEAFRLAKEVGDRLNLQRMYNNYASILAVYGSEYVSARAIAAEGVELGRRIGGWAGSRGSSGRSVRSTLPSATSHEPKS